MRRIITRLAIGTAWAAIALGSPLFILGAVVWAWATGSPSWPVAALLYSAAVMAAAMLIVSLYDMGTLVEGGCE